MDEWSETDAALAGFTKRLARKYKWAFGSYEDAYQELRVEAWKAFEAYHAEAETTGELLNKMARSMLNKASKSVDAHFALKRHGEEISLDSPTCPKFATRVDFDTRVYLREVLSQTRSLCTSMEARVLHEIIDGDEIYQAALRRGRSDPFFRISDKVVAPSVNSLAEACGISPSRASQALASLCDKARKVTEEKVA